MVFDEDDFSCLIINIVYRYFNITRVKTFPINNKKSLINYYLIFQDLQFLC